MSNLSQLRHGLQHAWQAISEGWQHLRERASTALTHFSLNRQNNLETADEYLMSHASRWGIIAAEVHEKENEVIVRLEVPGMEADQFDISVIENYLVVRGEKHIERQSDKGHYHVMECAYGRFERAIPLPVAVDDDKARAAYRKGVLTVTLPKHARVQKRRIEVGAK